MLTTEQLRARAKFWREKAVEVKWESVSIAQDMLQNADAFEELAANREAQPVGKAEITKIAAELVRGDYLSKLWTEAEKSRHVDTHRLQNLLDELHDVMKVKAIAITQLLTAPPAPANANSVAWEMRYWNSGHNCWHDWERITAEQHAEMSVQHAADNDYEFRVLYDAPPAPAVPPEKKLPELMMASYHEAIGWNACRAAMLDQPVSGGYTLPDGFKLMPLEITDEIAEAIAMEARCCGGIALDIYEAALAAAPEGGK